MHRATSARWRIIGGGYSNIVIDDIIPRWIVPTPVYTIVQVSYYILALIYLLFTYCLFIYIYIIIECLSPLKFTAKLSAKSSPNINVKVKIITCPLVCLENYPKNHLLYCIILVILKLFYQNYKNL